MRRIIPWGPPSVRAKLQPCRFPHNEKTTRHFERSEKPPSIVRDPTLTPQAIPGALVVPLRRRIEIPCPGSQVLPHHLFI